MKATWRILVIDDEAVMRESLAAWLREDGYEVDTAASGREGIEKARETDYAIYFVDLKMPGGIDGIETMMEVKKLRPEASIVIITAYATVDTAITAMKEGALEYIVKPCNPQEISLLVTRIIKVKKLERENEILRRRLSGRWRFHDLLSKSPRMQEIFALVKDVASLRSTVLITGRERHGQGARRARPPLLRRPRRASRSSASPARPSPRRSSSRSSSGTRRGRSPAPPSGGRGSSSWPRAGRSSSTRSATSRRRSRSTSCASCRSGASSASAGARRSRSTCGSSRRRTSTSPRRCRQGRFRDDLFYRLNVVAIHLPPLRERPEDVPLLARAFLERLSQELGKEAEDLSEGALKALLAHRWPGNVRELENAVERALVTAKGRVLTEEDFAFLRPVSEAAPGWTVPTHLPLSDVERSVIAATLKRNDGNVKETAAVLGIDRSTLYDKLKKYGIER